MNFIAFRHVPWGKAIFIFILTLCFKLSYAQASPDVPAPPPDQITLGQAVILGIVEGLTEYLPVSSTGHLILTGYFMDLVHFSEQTGPLGKRLDTQKMQAVNGFNIIIQFGAILAVIGLYRKRVGQMCTGLVGKNSQGLKLFLLIVVAFLPAAIAGLIFHARIEEFLFGPLPVAYALAVGGVFMILTEYLYRRRLPAHPRVANLEDMTYRQAFIIGLVQITAMWPGTSRSMVTIIAALLVGLEMVAAAEFSFLLALPTLSGATAYSAFSDWTAIKQAAGFDALLVGLIVSAIVAALAVKGFVKWLTRHGLTPFGFYRIIIAALIFWLLAS